MKNTFRNTFSIAITLLLIMQNNVYATSINLNNVDKNLVHILNSEPEIDPVKFQQTKAQVDLFKQVLDELGATSPSQVVELWAKSESHRNGVYQYAVSCDELKKEIIKKWGTPEENFWIIGGSSPWTYKHEIVKNEKVNDSTYKITIKFYWETSGGIKPPTFNTLTIIKGEKYWCVKEVK